MPTCRSPLVLIMFLLTVASVDGQQPSPVGRIKQVAGSASIVRLNAEIPAAVGAALFEADALRTGADGRIGLVLHDDTRLSLGPASEIELRRFAFAPAEGNLAFVLRVARGVVGYVSGRIAKLSPDAVRLETPTAIVGVRGTRLAIRVTAP
jgi:hypothetical protein